MSASLHAERQAAPLVLEELSSGASAEWDAFARANGSHYHRAGWARVIRESFGHRAHYRIARGPDGIEGVLPVFAFAHPVFGRSLVSVPFLNRGGIVATTERARVALLEEARRLVAVTRSTHCELRHVHAMDGTLPARTNKVSMSLALTDDPEALWNGLDAKVRNLVRKAQRGGLTARPGDPERDLPRFYEVFAENMRDLGTPVYSPRFFREVFREFASDLSLTIVEHGTELAAAGICVAQGPFTEIHWAASRRRLLALAPNMLLYWESIAAAARAGRTEFCFGRSTEDSGPYRFKKQWGALPTRLHWEYVLAPGAVLPERNPENPKFRLAIRLWQRLPVAVTRVLGPPIVRHLP